MDDEDGRIGQQTPEEAKPVELTDAAMEAVAGGTKTAPDRPVENISFNFAKTEFKY